MLYEVITVTQGIIVRNWPIEGRVKNVITSYSIHYTKLYDRISVSFVIKELQIVKS